MKVQYYDSEEGPESAFQGIVSCSSSNTNFTQFLAVAVGNVTRKTMNWLSLSMPALYG